MKVVRDENKIVGYIISAVDVVVAGAAIFGGIVMMSSMTPVGVVAGAVIVVNGVSLDIESMVTPVFATLIFDDIIGLLKSIRRLNRATMSSAPDEPQKNYTASDEPFRYTGSSTGRSAVCIINDQYSQNQISDCLK